MIEIKNLYCGYGAKEVIKGINIKIAGSSFTGIIGPNGAGKSTFLKAICGLIKPFSGSAAVKEKNIFLMPKKILSKIIAFMPQNVEIYFPFTVKEFVLLGRYPYMNVFKIPSKSDYDAVYEVLEFAGIKDFAERKVSELSGGERQRALIAQTIAQGTDIMVFDEPVSHLDIGGQSDILKLLKSLNKKSGKTIIITLHDLNAAGEFCDTLMLMDGGKIKNAGSPQEVLNYKDIEEVYKTTVIVKNNPMSGKPYVIPITDR